MRTGSCWLRAWRWRPRRLRRALAFAVPLGGARRRLGRLAGSRLVRRSSTRDPAPACFVASSWAPLASASGSALRSGCRLWFTGAAPGGSSAPAVLPGEREEPPFGHAWSRRRPRWRRSTCRTSRWTRRDPSRRWPVSVWHAASLGEPLTLQTNPVAAPRTSSGNPAAGKTLRPVLAAPVGSQPFWTPPPRPLKSTTTLTPFPEHSAAAAGPEEIPTSPAAATSAAATRPARRGRTEVIARP